MPTKDLLDVLVYVSALAVAITVGRTNIKKQTITDQQNLIISHERTIAQQKDEIERLCARVAHLEEVIDGYSELVRERHLAGGHRQGSGNSPAHSKGAKNRSP
jgi:hypothetical protein